MATEITATAGGADVSVLDRELSGLDQLELQLPSEPSIPKKVWQTIWPKLVAIAIALFFWQIVVWTGWKPTYVLPGPVDAIRAIGHLHSSLIPGALQTLLQAVQFYLLALAIGTVLAVVITRIRVLRTAVSPLIAGLQTMPSVAWVPFAIVMFGIGSTGSIAFVSLAGTVPAVTIGFMSGIDAISPAVHRAGKVLGARHWSRYRHIVLPAALPGYVTGMKQGWAFLWRSLMAAELISGGTRSLGQLLSAYESQSQQASVVATMLVILIVGLIMDTVVFSRLERAVLVRRGLIQTS